MREKGIRLGRIFGIQIQLDWSWFFIFVLITWNLAAVFAELHPEWQPVLRWGTALSASLLFFASVLAHELAHALVAQAYGVPVRHITLMLFGGVAHIEKEPDSPKKEFLITAVGPLTSILLGFAFLLMGGTTARSLNLDMVQNANTFIAQLDPITTLLLWLGPINLILGVFNLIPGFPLDGGRILRATLWAATNNLQKATRWAATVGQIVAWMLILAGVSMIFGATIPVFGSGFVNGLWLAFIGWFLNNAAMQSAREVTQPALQESVLPIAQIVRTDPLTVPADMTVQTLVQEHSLNSDKEVFPVEIDGRLVGLVTMADAYTVPRQQWPTVHVEAIMTPNNQLATLPLANDAKNELYPMREYDVYQLLPVENGRYDPHSHRSD